MGNFYDDAQFGVIQRKWFGLTAKCGGDGGANPFGTNMFGTTDATTLDKMERWYPKGPIKLLKAGYMILATVGGGGTAMDVVPMRLRVNGANESGDVNIADAGAPYTIGSTVTFTNAVVDAGSYVGFRTGTPQSAAGTAANTATTTGTVAFFVDYVPQYENTGKWNS